MNGSYWQTRRFTLRLAIISMQLFHSLCNYSKVFSSLPVAEFNSLQSTAYLVWSGFWLPVNFSCVKHHDRDKKIALGGLPIGKCVWESYKLLLAEIKELGGYRIQNSKKYTIGENQRKRAVDKKWSRKFNVFAKHLYICGNDLWVCGKRYNFAAGRNQRIGKNGYLIKTAKNIRRV